MSSTKELARELRDKRVGVVLSAGYFGFFGHAGFVAAMSAVGLRPAAWAGTSAGALVAALAASGLEPAEISERLLRVKRRAFWDPAPITWIVDALRGRIPTGILAGRRFRRLLSEVLPVKRIEETKAPLIIATTDVTHASVRIHAEGDLVDAVCASCAYPGLFCTVNSKGSQLWDGGLVDKAPLRALAERFELDALLVHYLPSRSRLERPAGMVGYLGAMGRALAAARHQGFVWQAQLCEAEGLPVYVIAPELPPVSPARLERGREVIGLASAWAARALAAPAEESRPFARRPRSASRRPDDRSS